MRKRILLLSAAAVAGCSDSPLSPLESRDYPVGPIVWPHPPSPTPTPIPPSPTPVPVPTPLPISPKPVP